MLTTTRPTNASVGHEPATAKSHVLTFAAQCHHGGHQVQQWPSEVVLGGHDHVVVHAEVIDGDAGGWAVRHRDTDSASGEILDPPIADGRFAGRCPPCGAAWCRPAQFGS